MHSCLLLSVSVSVSPKTQTQWLGPKIIERKLSAVYTQGTLMGDFVVGDMSNFIMSIKVSDAGCL